MNQPLSRLPGHVFAPGNAPDSPVAQALDRTGQVMTNLADLAMPLIIALGAGLTMWVTLEMVRARRRARRRIKVPDWELPADARQVRPRRVRAARHSPRPEGRTDLHAAG